jgi:hypothetical protein
VFRHVKLQHRLVRILYRNVARFKVVTLLVQIEVFYGHAVCILLNIYRRFEESCCFDPYDAAVEKLNVIRNAITLLGALLQLKHHMLVVIVFK